MSYCELEARRSEQDIWSFAANKEGVKFDGTHQLLVYADDVNFLGENIYTTKKISRKKMATDVSRGVLITCYRRLQK